MQTRRKRWEGDTRGHGDRDGSWIEPEVRTMLEALSDSHWVAERPEDHLLPHVITACDAEGSPWVLNATESRDGVYVVDASWNRQHGRLRDLRTDVFALIGTVAESTTFVHQRLTGDAIEFRVATGMLSDDGPFAGHGHLILLRVTGYAFGRTPEDR